MTLLTAALLLAQAVPQEPVLYPTGQDDVIEFFVRPRAGIWISNAFEFKAIRTDSVQVDTNERTLYSGGLNAGVTIVNQFMVWASGEVSGTDKLRSNVAGVYAGYRDTAGPNAPPGIPHEAAAYVGGLWGTFEVKESGFGDFDDGYGFAAGLDLSWHLNRTFTLILTGEYRLMEFDYEEDILSGDTAAGGSSVWAGVGIDIRF